MEKNQINFPTSGQWISQKTLNWKKHDSPPPLLFRKKVSLKGKIKSVQIFCTAMGIYYLEIDGQRVGEDYFAPGFTSYRHQLQYQIYDVTAFLHEGSEICATVAGGWAVGAYTWNRKTRLAADLPSLLLELHIEYTDGKKECIGTDASWYVTAHGPLKEADLYNGETYNAQTDLKQIKWERADTVRQRFHPNLLPQYGPPVRVWKVFEPVNVNQSSSGEWIYDFGQNFAGIIDFKLTGHDGQTVIFRHAEILQNEELFIRPLRSAKQTVRYTCRSGYQEYSPRFTYMGFRYVGVTGIEPEAIEIRALALSSHLEETGSFQCSNPMLNRLNENIRHSARSNLMDIPTDCPQRDERMGWTGDIAVFARTACWNYNMDDFFCKWMKDVASEQSSVWGIPTVVPRMGHDWPRFVTACWGDCCTLVPWAEYMARGDAEILRQCYPIMKKFLRLVELWASVFSVGKQRYIWKLPFQFGDWCAPEGEGKQWRQKGPWIATAYFANSCQIAEQTALLLGNKNDAEYYRKLRSKIVDAYRSVFTDGQGKLYEEFQTGYVLPLYFNMVHGQEAKTMASRLNDLLKKSDYHLTTGFTGTPYLLFALADNGYAETAYRVLLQEKCPSWLYEVKSGATTIWERWDALDDNGQIKDGDMVSFNHYASGAVGDFLYRRVLGIEALEGGYRYFRVEPVLGGGITWAEGSQKTKYGTIYVRWEISKNIFVITVKVPQNTKCNLIMPDGQTFFIEDGSHQYTVTLK